jgi:uracil-DNA glycosylase
MTEKDERIEQLRAQAENCNHCGLCETRTNVVFGEGNPNSPLVIVGEGPGENEDKTGRPFVGRAGQLLDECLRECGIARRHIFITNVVRCRPTELNETGRTMNRAPTTEEAHACVTSWLTPILTTIDPLVILCLGGPSASQIIRKGFRIVAERGKFFDTPYANYAIASLHPAYILRQQGEQYDEGRALLIQDIEAARKKVIEARKEPPKTLF